MADQDKWYYITLLFDPEAYNAEADTSFDGEFNGAILSDFGKDLNDYSSHFLGYSGWQMGQVIPNEPSKEDIKHAMDILKAAGCQIEIKLGAGRTMTTDPPRIVFVVHVPLDKMEDV